jgi:small RNA 2'-O-methyltransferase
LKRRERPLKVDIYKGDISLENECLLNADAIVGIEVYENIQKLFKFRNYFNVFTRIEHLFPETLENLPFTIFGYAKPKLVILTTPNCEYNVYFKGMVGFRHDDHKFEWTRQEFEDW